MSHKRQVFHEIFGNKKDEIINRCTRLVENKTDYEKRFNLLLKPLSILFGFSYLQQHPISITGSKYYILDFFIPELKLAFEIDGEVHDNQIDYDLKRDNDLMGLGIYVVRYKNNEILKSKTITSIFNTIGRSLELKYNDQVERSKNITNRISAEIIDRYKSVNDYSNVKFVNKVIDNNIKNLLKSYYKRQEYGKRLVSSGYFNTNRQL